MRKLIVQTFLTLDGVMQAPGGPQEDTEGGFEHGGWQAPYFGDADGDVLQALDNAGALLLGRKTYDIFASYWPHVGEGVEPLDKEDIEFADFMNRIPKYVASTKYDKLDWQNSTLLKGDMAEAVRQLKQEDGKDICVIGSGNFTQTLMREDLVDEYYLLVHPLLLGKGKRLFGQDIPKQNLKLLNSKTTAKGVLLLTYQVVR